MLRFEEVYDRFRRGRLSALEASEWLGVSERTFRRQRGRFEEEGLAGLLGRRLGKASPHRVPADETARVLELYRTRYRGWPVKLLIEDIIVFQRPATPLPDREHRPARSPSGGDA